MKSESTKKREKISDRCLEIKLVSLCEMGTAR